MQIELRPIDQVKPYPGNPRQNDDAVDAVAASLKEFGFRQPIVVDAEGVIIVGHTRYKAACKLGLTQVPVHVATDLTPAQVKAYRIADNATNEIAEWNYELLPIELSALQEMHFDIGTLGFDDEELQRIMSGDVQEGLTDPDDVPLCPLYANGSMPEACQMLVGLWQAGQATSYTYEFEEAGLPNTARLRRTASTAGGQSVFQGTYAYNLNGQISDDDLVQKRSDGSNADRGFTYTYDQWDQIDTVRQAGQSSNAYDYGFDAAGNRIGEFGAVSNLNQYGNFQYDERGNLINDGQRTFFYDALDRLVEVTPDAPDAQSVRAEYGYDSDGRRTWKKVYAWDDQAEGWQATPAQHLKFLYDGWNLAAELQVNTDGSEMLLRSYAWGLDLGGGIGGLLAINVHNSDGSVAHTYIPAFDGNGNVMNLVDASNGSVAASYRYDPFGNLIESTGAAKDDNPFRFSTKYFDPESGLYYYGYRYYSPVQGRWITRDPIAEQGGVNLYAFVGNDPGNAVDPLGQRSLGGHTQLTVEASRQYAPGGKMSALDRLEFYEGLAEGAVRPDLQYAPATAASSAIKGSLAVWNRFLNANTGGFIDAFDDVKDSVKEAGKEELKDGWREYGPWTYGKARGVRNWWNNSSIINTSVIGKVESGIEAAAGWVGFDIDLNLDSTDLYRSHYGDWQWKHGMSNGKLDATATRDTMVDETVRLLENYREALIQRDYRGAGKCLGEALHYLQDTWTASHTVRNAQGQITRFQSYLDQGPGWHATADDVKIWSAEGQHSVGVSVALMKLADRKIIRGKELGAVLSINFFPLADNAESGGTLAAFAPRYPEENPLKWPQKAATKAAEIGAQAWQAGKQKSAAAIRWTVTTGQAAANGARTAWHYVSSWW